MPFFYHRESSPDFGNPAERNEFAQGAENMNSLIQKELSVNKEEQELLEQRIRMMKEFVNDLPSSDPQYSMMLTSMKMDQIELDELKIRASLLLKKSQESRNQ